MARIVVSYSDPQICESWRQLLEENGHWVLTLSGEKQLSRILKTHAPDLVLASEGDASALQEAPMATIPILVLVDNHANTVTPEVLPRTRAGFLSTLAFQGSDALPYINQLLQAPSSVEKNGRWKRFGNLEMEKSSCSVRLGNDVIKGLPKKLFDLLWFLVKRAQESKDIASRELITSRLWKYRVRDRQVDVTVSRLKERIPFLASHIETIPGKGYRILLP